MVSKKIAVVWDLLPLAMELSRSRVHVFPTTHWSTLVSPYNTKKGVDMGGVAPLPRWQPRWSIETGDGMRSLLSIEVTVVECSIPWWEPLGQHRKTLAVG